MLDEQKPIDDESGVSDPETPSRTGLVRSIAHWLASDGGALPDEGRLAPFDGATAWLNSEPLTPQRLRGRVVLVDFWTYTCVNWIRTLPYVRAWASKYEEAGLTVVGVHTPEFGFESDLDNVVAQTRNLGVEYPSRSTASIGSGARSRTASGPPSISPTLKGGSGTTTSERASTRRRRW